jgi:hypothetical protein
LGLEKMVQNESTSLFDDPRGNGHAGFAIGLWPDAQCFDQYAQTTIRRGGGSVAAC